VDRVGSNPEVLQDRRGDAFGEQPSEQVMGTDLVRALGRGHLVRTVQAGLEPRPQGHPICEPGLPGRLGWSGCRTASR